jgi:hypothetical protein
MPSNVGSPNTYRIRPWSDRARVAAHAAIVFAETISSRQPVCLSPSLFLIPMRRRGVGVWYNAATQLEIRGLTMGAKAQHIVPSLNLRNFAGTEPAGQVWTYDCVSGRSWSKIPEETGTVTHFYSVQKEDGTQDTRIEEMLSAIESRASSVYGRLLRGDIPKKDTQARVYFAEFLAMMYVRTPGMRRMNAEIHSRRLQTLTFAYAQNDAAFNRLIKGVEKDRGETITPDIKEEVRAMLRDPSAYDVEVPKRMTLSILGAADKIAPIIYNMKWSLGQPLSGFFITGDNPVIRTVDPKTRHPVMGDGGFSNKTAELSFPLSTDAMLVTSWDEGALDFGLIEREHVDKLNELRAIHADRFLYSHVDDKSISNLAEKFGGSRPEIRFSGFGPSNFSKTTVSRK